MKVAATGQMRERVTIQAPTITGTPSGDQITVYSDFLTLWARMEPKRVNAIAEALRETVKRDWNCTIRYRTDVRSYEGKLRVVWRGRYFNAQGDISTDEQRQFLMITLEEFSPTAEVP